MEPDAPSTPKRNFDPDWPHGHVTAADGFPARIVCRDAKGDLPIVALVQYRENDETPRSFAADGRARGEAAFSLVNAPAPKKRLRGWVNIYRDNGGLDTLLSYPTREYADLSALKDRLACVYLDIEEGEGL